MWVSGLGGESRIEQAKKRHISWGAMERNEISHA